jgi:hypothetical protein
MMVYKNRTIILIKWRGMPPSSNDDHMFHVRKPNSMEPSNESHQYWKKTENNK